MKMKFLSDRRFKHGSLATVITIGFIVAVIIVNFIATLLLDRYPLDIDLTKDNRFALTSDSIEYVNGIDEEVKIIVCVEENKFKGIDEYFKQAYEVIENYKKHNPKIKIEYVDLVKNPTFTQKYPKEKIMEGSIIVESKKRMKVLTVNDLFNIKQDQTGQGNTQISSKAEQTMTAALMYVMDENPTTVTLIQTGSNSDLAAYMTVLKQNNYNVETINIMTEDIKKESKIAILPAPKVDLSSEQLKKIDAFLENGGEYGKTLMFVAAQDQTSIPNVDEFLKDWGIKVNPGIIMETDSKNYFQSPFNAAANIVDENIAKAMKNPDTFLISSFAHPIETLFDEKDSRKTTSIVTTAETTVLMPAFTKEQEEEAKKFDPKKEPKKSFNTIVRADKTKYVGTDLKQSSVVAFGSEAMISDLDSYMFNFMSNAAFKNSELALQLANVAANKEESIKILPIEFSQESIQITNLEVIVYTIIFLYALPLAMLIIGLIIWLRRRHL